MSIPKRYLSGLSPEERKKRIDEIKRGRKTATSDKSAYSSSRFKTDKDKKTKTSKYTQRGRKLLANSDAKTLDAKLRVLARKTGYSEATLRKVYNRGLAAWRTGHRPGASQHAWGMARVYSFVTGGKTSKTADKDLASRKMKEAVAFKRGLSLAKSIGRATQKASGAASFDVVQRGGKSVRIKRDLGGAGGGQFVSYKVAQAEDLKKSFVVNRRVARMRGKPTSTQQYTVAERPEPSTAPSPQQVLDQLKDALKQDSVPLQDEPLWKRDTDIGYGDLPKNDMDVQGPIDTDTDFGRSIAKVQRTAAEAGRGRIKKSEDKPITSEEELAMKRMESLGSYTANGHSAINRDMQDLLSGRKAGVSDRTQTFMETFDELSIEAKEDHSVFRGGGGGWTEAVLGWQRGRATEFVGSISDLKKMVGHTFRTDSFISTSRAPWVAANGQFEYPSFLAGERVSYIFRFHRKKGSRMMAVERTVSLASIAEEREIILPAEEKYVVRGFTLAGGNHPALQDDEGFSYDWNFNTGLTDDDMDVFRIDDDLDIEDPVDVASGGGSRNRRPVVIIEVEQI